MTGCWKGIDGGILVVLRVTPNASVERIEGVETRDDGTEVLRVRVRAVPDKGKANAAVVALLARALDLPRSAVVLRSGETARIKSVAITGDPQVLVSRLEALIF